MNDSRTLAQGRNNGLLIPPSGIRIKEVMLQPYLESRLLLYRRVTSDPSALPVLAATPCLLSDEHLPPIEVVLRQCGPSIVNTTSQAAIPRFGKIPSAGDIVERSDEHSNAVIEPAVEQALTFLGGGETTGT